jgi:hypothetical protein
MDFSNRTKYAVIRGSRYGLSEGKQYPAGHALQFEGTVYYVLKLWFQPNVTYFISKNDEESQFHTVFTKKIQEEDGSVRFQNPVGYARGLPDKEHLEIVLPDFSRRYYMSLFPAA